MINVRLDTCRRGDHPLQADAGVNAEPVEHVEQILRRQIPRGSRGIRATAEPAGGRVEHGDASLQRGVDVDQRRPPGVVKMHGDLRHLDAARGDRVDHRAHLARMSDPDRIAQRYFAGAHLDQLRRDRGDRLKWNRALERATEHGGQIRSDAQSRSLGLPADLRIGVDRLLH